MGIDMIEFTPKVWFQAALVAYDLKRRPVYVQIETFLKVGE